MRKHYVHIVIIIFIHVLARLAIPTWKMFLQTIANPQKGNISLPLSHHNIEAQRDGTELRAATVQGWELNYMRPDVGNQ